MVVRSFIHSREECISASTFSSERNWRSSSVHCGLRTDPTTSSLSPISEKATSPSMVALCIGFQVKENLVVFRRGLKRQFFHLQYFMNTTEDPKGNFGYYYIKNKSDIKDRTS